MKKIISFVVLLMLFNLVAPVYTLAAENQPSVKAEQDVEDPAASQTDEAAELEDNDQEVLSSEPEVSQETESSESTKSDVDEPVQDVQEDSAPKTSNSEETTTVPAEETNTNAESTIEESTEQDQTEQKEEQNAETATEEPSLSSSSIEAKAQPVLAFGSTSRLGHLGNNSRIYGDLTDVGTSSYKVASQAGLTNAVYYTKWQAELNGVLYYSISTQPSSTNGVVGWVKASEFNNREHKSISNERKTLYVKGTGDAYTKAWGGSKDKVYTLSSLKGQKFEVNLTEKVGGNTWYRGMLNGKNVFIHSSYVSTGTAEESATSRLGHLGNNSRIYSDLSNLSTYKVASQAGLTNAVYYAKRQAVLNGVTYYKISTQPSSTNGVVGWVKASDFNNREHKSISNERKTLYVKGTGDAYAKAWGGSKDKVYTLSSLKGEKFEVNLTEKVGDNTWYRGMLNGKNVFIHSSYVTTSVIKESATSRLGHLGNDSRIYSDLNNLSSYKVASQAGYTNAVYYAKQQAELNGELYYKISTQPSSTNGVVGWVKAADFNNKTHKSVSNERKTLYVKGTGEAYTKAWGGSKDKVYTLSSLKGQKFEVNLTEKVGDNTWYRGTLNGKTVFIHSSYVVTYKDMGVVSATSRLGHLQKDAVVYKDWSVQTGGTVASKGNLTDTVYYVKRQVKVADEVFYLISTEPSAERGVVGWVRSGDLNSRAHVGVDKTVRNFYVTGKGKSYTKAWGGSKDVVEGSMSKYAGESFRVNLTEKVGDNIWYRGVMNNKTMWLHESYVAESYQKETKYNLTLQEALNIQQKLKPKEYPQTDSEYDAYVSQEYIKDGKVTADLLNVRGGPSTDFWVLGTLTKGAQVDILGQTGSWYKIKFTENKQWVNASPTDIAYYLNPNNFINDEKQKFQFLDLTHTSDVDEKTLNNYLVGKGKLENQGKAFIDASKLNGINDIYLVSHAILETGNGKSALSQGIEYNGRTVYNMFGIGAIDACPEECGAARAYKEGWFTPYDAIVGGAQYIGTDFIGSGQNTLYKMRWNPEAMDQTGSASNQYATDIGWASKQVSTMYNLYRNIGIYTLYLDIPHYK